MNRSLLAFLSLTVFILSACSNSSPALRAGFSNDRPATAADAIVAVSLPEMTVYKSPTCGCCGDWITHMEEHGFTIKTIQTDNMVPIKAENGVPIEMQSCHTAVVDGYVIEGHVPADDVVRLLNERPAVGGLAVPGMPIGSPGMEIEGQPAQPFDVVTFDQTGQVAVFSSYAE